MPLAGQPGVRFAGVVAAHIQRAAQRANRPLIGRAMAHFFWFVALLAHHAILTAAPFSAPLAAPVIAALGAPGNQRRRQQRAGQAWRSSGANGCAVGPKAPIKHATDNTEAKPIAPPHRVDVVQMGAAKLNAGRAQPQGLLITNPPPPPQTRKWRYWNTAQHLANGLEHLQLHQQQAIRILNTIHTTRPGWLWVNREKFDHASEPA